MYQEKVKTILIVNSYLTKCKMENPQSSISRVVQKYSTHQINKTLNDNNKKASNVFPLLSFFLFIR
jgi:hypothetical protein